ncbi:MAG: glycine--tRNA ligase subunit beta [Halieaceae bacterium]|nr:glycine--tRNA ligase subunit beta [Halieaceae bacterium]
MSTETLLIELGTEELPPRALRSLSEAFSASIIDGLAQNRLEHGAHRSFATPRRLAVLIEDVVLKADDEQVEALGPPADKARQEDGSWSPAAAGFARKQGLEPEQLEIVETDKGPRLCARKLATGAATADALPGILSAAVRELPIPKRMRWGASRSEFVRPVHWLVMMLGDAVVDCEVLDQRAGKQTRGHRFHAPEAITLERAADYEESLTAARVVADLNARRTMIEEQVAALAQELGAEASIEPALLDEVTALVEWPVALAGSFEERFLTVPQEALVSSMQEHQKYFPVVDADGKLLPHFIFVSNIESQDPAQVVDGNERVIRPRLADADFFFETDRQQSLASRVEALKSIVFQQRLGTLHDKTERLQALAQALAVPVGADPEQASRAALLSKADLLTQLVGEFPDLQGIAGRYYAEHDGETADVADAMQQQYWPAYAGDRLPQAPVATALALADRLDTLVGIFGIGQAPTGSKDPFALRRAALGVLRILVEKELPIDLRDALGWAAANYPAGTLQEGCVEDVTRYMLERLRAWYEDADIPVEVFKAVDARDISTPLDFDHRVRAVHAFTALPEAAALAAANKRVSNILSKQGSDGQALEVSEGLLTEPAEQSLAKALASCQPDFDAHMAAGAYTEALAALASLQAPVDQFFDDVMVMADDEAVRNNRLGLLGQLHDQFLQVADISELAPAR